MFWGNPNIMQTRPIAKAVGLVCIVAHDHMIVKISYYLCVALRGCPKICILLYSTFS